MKRRRWESHFLVLFLSVCLLAAIAGCVRQFGQAEEPDSRFKIVCTIFPEYDWVKQILGERAEEVELTVLMKNGADLHSYQPTMWDIKEIAEADLFLYVGGESDFWVEAVLANTGNPSRVSLNLLELLEDSVKEEEHLEGMQEARGHEHSEEAEYDEHVWLSLRNAKEVCRRIAEALCELDFEHWAVYEKNLAAYEEQLDALDLEYTKTVRESKNPVLLFGDRFPFRYLAEDYGLTCYAAFPGCSAETEASFSTITFLAGKAGEQSLPVILAIDGSDQKIARTIAENTRTRDTGVRMLDSMQSVSSDKIEAGENYLSIMERNLAVLKEALAVEGGM